MKKPNKQVYTVGADRDLFGHIMIPSGSRDIDLREVISYELSMVPFSLNDSNQRVHLADFKKW